ncbi:uncharacterized protein TOL2_C30870 [Desulfobacula toluolica Tol2]|uniref:Uncharacterized protein n=1 Tax=Desulfobacula toluolica (strain DSM 7467 / Tol2) TaxID=651182 RepID=K0NHK6_DESTT|nr:uncharacterized protein TOL2_C20170 [Desulfobacula toluolica Tol2]CCK80208.1 uncharacterized protein TOL2_C20470 [Desulfobacula toluolica Tol2]CCK80776.1 uncharacterized protein TOL2_C26170 [Desulfobacula toluolica Tol2]CCK81244.1 uncharacterized protein TOL2_C30870 [Desulfobacula toluolica Tol2]
MKAHHSKVFSTFKKKETLAVRFTRLLCAGHGTRLKGEPASSFMEVKASPKPSQMEAKGIVLSQRGPGDGTPEGSGFAEAEWHKSTG